MNQIQRLETEKKLLADEVALLTGQRDLANARAEAAEAEAATLRAKLATLSPGPGTDEPQDAGQARDEDEAPSSDNWSKFTDQMGEGATSREDGRTGGLSGIFEALEDLAHTGLGEVGRRLAGERGSATAGGGGQQGRRTPGSGGSAVNGALVEEGIRLVVDSLLSRPRSR